MVVSGTQLEVWVDCSRVYRRLAPPPATNLTALAALAPPLDPSDPTLSQDPSIRDSPMALYLGQRNTKHFLFKVSTVNICQCFRFVQFVAWFLGYLGNLQKNQKGLLLKVPGKEQFRKSEID